MPYRILLYYQFVHISDPSDFAEVHLEMCRYLGLRGRILVAEEGINGTVSGPVESCEYYMQWMHRDPRFASMQFKIDESPSHAFKAMHVRVRDEIICLGEEMDKPVWELTGKHLSASEWKKMLKRDDVIVLDGRNDYESKYGRFEGALTPHLESFRDFPEWIRANLAAYRDKPILTYCTGGIRCEKLTAWMIQEGFQEVYQLDGGIVTYGKDEDAQGEGYEGTCYVFDDRISVPINHTPEAKLITHCIYCGEPTIRSFNCANVDCNAQVTGCAECEAAHGSACSEACATAERQREPGQKLDRARTKDSDPLRR